VSFSFRNSRGLHKLPAERANNALSGMIHLRAKGLLRHWVDSKMLRERNLGDSCGIVAQVLRKQIPAMNTVIDQLFALQQVELQKSSKLPATETSIKELRALIPDPVLGHYDRLLARGKKGVALVRNGVCSECHMRVAIGVLATLMRREDIQLCGSCGRYLYLPAEPESPAAPAATETKETKPAPKRRKAKKTEAHAI